MARKQGRLEMAQGGTIVLDEVAALTPGMQAKLLRVIEERTFERLGGTDTLRMEARLMALTNTDLAKAVAAGPLSRRSLLPLNVLAVPVPPLRERRADIPALAAHFLARLGSCARPPGRDLSIPPTLHLLETYAWPGNVRELKNAIEHALMFGRESLLQPHDFPEIIQRSAAASPDPSGRCARSNDLERDAIKATLEATRYKIGRAAEILGISRKTLLEKRKKYGLLE